MLLTKQDKEFLVEIRNEFGLPLLVARRLIVEYKTRENIIDYIKKSEGSLAPFIMDYKDSEKVKELRKEYEQDLYKK